MQPSLALLNSLAVFGGKIRFESIMRRGPMIVAMLSNSVPDNAPGSIPGTRGAGGQVPAARAVLANPAILILDEATSSLDSVSEVLVQQGLAQLMKGRTTFVIAHRLSTVRRADQILVIEDGRLVEQGTAEQLSALGGRYAELYATQNGLEALLATPADPEPEPRANIAVADVTVPGFS